MKKIGYVLANFPVLSETFVSTEIRAMEECGHDILPIAFNHYGGQYQACDNDLKEKTIYLSDHSNKIALKALSILRPSFIKALKFALNQTGIPIKSLVGNALKLAYIAKKNHCTHIHAHFSQSAAATAIVAARLCGLTVSFVGHGHDIYAVPQDLKLKLKSVDFAVAVCLDMAWHFRNIAPKANTSLIYCGVDTNRFAKNLIEHHHNTNSHTNSDNARHMQAEVTDSPPKEKLLYIGRLSETKGLFTLLEALNKIEPSKRPCIDFVGAGVLKDKLEQFSQDNGLEQHVNFMGPKQSSWLIDNAHHYAALTVPFEMASNGDRDSGPVVVKEAMALKLPIITTYFMGCKEMLTQECSLRVPPKDSTSLAKMIKRFFEMPQTQINSMVESAYERVNTHYSANLQAICLSTMVEQTASKQTSFSG